MGCEEAACEWRVWRLGWGTLATSYDGERGQQSADDETSARRGGVLDRCVGRSGGLLSSVVRTKQHQSWADGVRLLSIVLCPSFVWCAEVNGDGDQSLYRSGRGTLLEWHQQPTAVPEEAQNRDAF